MIPEMKSPKLLPLFTGWMRATSTDYDQSYQYTRQRVPLECQVFAVEPSFVISDKYHLVQCEFSQEAIVLFKKIYRLVGLKDLKGKFLILMQYAPHSRLGRSTDLVLALHIYEFTLYSTENDLDSTVGDPVELIQAAEIAQLADLTRKGHLRQAIRNTKTLNELPKLEEILTSPESAECGNVVITVADAKGKKTLDVLGEKIVDYSRIDDIEKKAILKAERLIEEDEKERQRRRAERAAAHAAAQAKKLGKIEDTVSRREQRLKGKDIAELLKKKSLPSPRHSEKISNARTIEAGVSSIISRVHKGKLGYEEEQTRRPFTRLAEAHAVALAKKEGRGGMSTSGKYSTRQTAKRSRKVDEKAKKAASTAVATAGTNVGKRTTPMVTANALKRFACWKVCAGRSVKANKDMAGELRKTKVGTIQVTLKDAEQRQGKAFSSWAGSDPLKKKRAAPEPDVTRRWRKYAQ